VTNTLQLRVLVRQIRLDPLRFIAASHGEPPAAESLHPAAGIL